MVSDKEQGSPQWSRLVQALMEDRWPHKYPVRGEQTESDDKTRLQKRV